MTDQELNDIEELTNAATPGPWYQRHDGWTVRQGAYEDEVRGPIIAHTMTQGGDVEKQVNDSAFIAESRQFVPALIAEVRRLRERLTGGA